MRIIFGDVAGGIGDFSVATGRFSDKGGAPSVSPGESAAKRVPGRGNSHYVILLNRGWEQEAPLRFNNAMPDDLRNRFRITARAPLPEMPEFFPAGAEGELVFGGREVLHLDSALSGQPLFSHLESLRDLVRRVADRTLAFPEFLARLNGLDLPVAWRNEIVNGLFSHADAGLAAVSPQPGFSGNLDRLMDLLHRESGGGSQLSPSLNAFLEEVGRDSTGFILRDGAAKELQGDLERTLQALRGSLLSRPEVAEALGFLSSLQRMARLAKGRERQTVHLWSHLPDDPRALLQGDQANPEGDFAVALALLDAPRRDAAFLVRAADLAREIGCPMLVQVPDGGIPGGDAFAAFAGAAPRSGTFLFSGGVASRVEGEGCVFRPAALAFLEGLIASRENVDYYLHHGMVLEDQDLAADKGPARATDRILDNAQWEAELGKALNRVNGARNRAEARFPLLRPWAGA